MQAYQEPGEDITRPELVHFELQARRGGEISHEGFWDSKHSDEAVGEGILKKAQPGSEHDPEDFVPADESEINGKDKGEIEKTCQGNLQRKRDL